jgi:hypothetical protein
MVGTVYLDVSATRPAVVTWGPVTWHTIHAVKYSP